MNTQADSSGTTAPSLEDLATAAKRAEFRAHRRTLGVTVSIAFAAIVAMSVWSLALRHSAEIAREQAQIAREQAQIAHEQAQFAQNQAQIAEDSYRLALTAVIKQLAELQRLLNNSGVTVATAKTLLAPMEATLAGLDSIQANPDTTKAQIRLLLTLSDTYSSLGEVKEAFARAIQARSLASQLDSARSADARRLIFDASWRIGDLLSDIPDYTGAIREFESALSIARQAVDETPNDLSWQTSLSFVLIKVGDAMYITGRLDDAIGFYRQALMIAEKATMVDPNIVSAQRDLARVFMRLGDVLAVRGDFDGALSIYTRALDILDQLTTKEPSDGSLQLELARVHRIIGDVQQAQGHADPAIMSYQSALTILERLVALDSSNVFWQTQLAQIYVRLGDAFKIDGRHNNAREQYSTALRLQEELAAKRPDDAQLQRSLESLRGKVKSLESEKLK